MSIMDLVRAQAGHGESRTAIDATRRQIDRETERGPKGAHIRKTDSMRLLRLDAETYREVVTPPDAHEVKPWGAGITTGSTERVVYHPAHSVPENATARMTPSERFLAHGDIVARGAVEAGMARDNAILRDRMRLRETVAVVGKAKPDGLKVSPKVIRQVVVGVEPYTLPNGRVMYRPMLDSQYHAEHRS